MDLNRDIHSLTDFKKNTADFLKQLKATGEPVVLPINGKSELVVQDADRHADLLETYNRQFHGALISGCNSRWLLHFHGLMYDQSLRYRMLAFRVKDFPRDQSRREHKQILDAALARDVETLVAVLGTHITKGAEMYAEHEAAARGRGKTRRKAKR